MIESKLWHNKTEIENEKLAKMVEFIKTCDQIPYKFNFGHFFCSDEMGNFLLPGGAFCLG